MTEMEFKECIRCRRSYPLDCVETTDDGPICYKCKEKENQK